MGKILKVILFPGIGDIIYTWYKLQYYYKLGYSFNIFVPDLLPHRAHQLVGMIDGINNIEYMPILDLSRYNKIDPISMINPNPECLYKEIPFIYTNSFIEANIHLNNFMVEAPVDYNVKINIEDKYKKQAEQIISRNDANIFLYTGSMKAHLDHNHRPDPHFWNCLSITAAQYFFKNKQICIHLCGAEYDTDLMYKVAHQLYNYNMKFILHIDKNLQFIFSLLQNCDISLVEDSGIIMLADLAKVPTIAMYYKRDNLDLPYTGIISDNAYYSGRMLEIKYYETLKNIQSKFPLLRLKNEK